MQLTSLAMVASLMVVAVPAFAAQDSQSPDFKGLRERQEQLKAIPSARLVSSVQDRLPQAEIANLLSQVEDASRGTGAISAADAGRIEDELERQKQFWFEEYQKALSKSTGANPAFADSPETGKEFDDLFGAVVSPDPNEISPESLRLVYQEYALLSQTFQLLKLARFLSASGAGITRYHGPKADATETAAMAAEVDQKYVPVYQQRIQDGVTTLRKILVATKAGN
ncbi:MAG: hypothetical protein HY816_19260 [Candidatus Wallbacteria bacterium]|nr:hypothetical protein [Candidatus Wallbacteria bacterium]